MSITALTLITVTEARCLGAELSNSTISKATRQGMEEAMQPKAIMTPAKNTRYPDIGVTAMASRTARTQFDSDKTRDKARLRLVSLGPPTLPTSAPV
jgi:hypothetical protein